MYNLILENTLATTPHARLNGCHVALKLKILKQNFITVSVQQDTLDLSCVCSQKKTNVSMLQLLFHPISFQVCKLNLLTLHQTHYVWPIQHSMFKKVQISRYKAHQGMRIILCKLYTQLTYVDEERWNTHTKLCTCIKMKAKGTLLLSTISRVDYYIHSSP